MAHRIDQRQALHRPFVHAGQVEAHGVAPGFLGPDHGDLGMLDEGLGIAAVAGEARDSGAAGDEQALVLFREGRGDRRQHLVHHRGRLALVDAAFQQQHEFVVAGARHGAGGAGQRQDAFAGLAQQAVAGRVAQAVVDVLEVVEVERHHPYRPALRARERDRARDAVGQQHPVRQAGQGVVVGAVFEFGFVLAGRGDVVFADDEMVGHALRVLDRGQVDVGEPPRAVLARELQHHVAFAPLAQGIVQFVEGRLLVAVGRQHVDRLADDLLRAQAVQALEGGIDVDDGCALGQRVHQDDRIRARFDGALGQPQRLGRAAQVGGALVHQGLDVSDAARPSLHMGGGGDAEAQAGQQDKHGSEVGDSGFAGTRAQFPGLPGHGEALGAVEQYRAHQLAGESRFAAVEAAEAPHLAHRRLPLHLAGQGDFDAGRQVGMAQVQLNEFVDIDQDFAHAARRGAPFDRSGTGRQRTVDRQRDHDAEPADRLDHGYQAAGHRLAGGDRALGQFAVRREGPDVVTMRGGIALLRRDHVEHQVQRTFAGAHEAAILLFLDLEIRPYLAPCGLVGCALGARHEAVGGQPVHIRVGVDQGLGEADELGVADLVARAEQQVDRAHGFAGLVETAFDQGNPYFLAPCEVVAAARALQAEYRLVQEQGDDDTAQQRPYRYRMQGQHGKCSFQRRLHYAHGPGGIEPPSCHAGANLSRGRVGSVQTVEIPLQ